MEKDAHYEHLVVNHHLICGQYYTFCFAETKEDFAEGDYGVVHYAVLPTGWKMTALSATIWHKSLCRAHR